MIIDRISYQRVFAIGNYVTERIGLEASLDTNDNPQTELEHLKIIVNDLHSATIATLEETRGTQVRTIEPVEDKVESWKQVISMCTSKKAVEMFRVRVEETGDIGLTELFEKKLLEVQ